MQCPATVEAEFGPVVPTCRRPFDFTLLFEEVFFQLVPSCIFVVVAFTRVLVLVSDRSSLKVRLGPLYAIKLTTVAVLAALQLATLILICRTHRTFTSLSVPSAALQVVAVLALAALTHLEHTRSLRPSYLIGLYLTVNVLLQSATSRTYWHTYGNKPITAVYIASVVVQVVVIALEECSKRKWIVGEHDGVSLEETSGFLNRSLFAWLAPLFSAGYRRTITPLDTQPIDSSISSTLLEGKFSWLQAEQSSGSWGLLIWSYRCLGLCALSPVLPRLCLSAFTFCQPFLASSMITYLGNSSASDDSGYGLIGAAFLVYAGIAISTGWYWHLNYKCTTMIRGGLVDVIDQKLLRLHQEKGVQAKVLTLSISDVQRIVSALSFTHELWIAPIETAIATWLLWRQLGPSSLTVLGIALIATTASAILSRHVGAQQGVWLAATEKRIATTKMMLSSLKAIKMTGATERTGLAIERLRRLEFAASRMFRSLIVGSLVSSYSTLSLAPVVALGAYIGATQTTGAGFDPSRLFSSLILISLLATPLVRLLQIIPSFGTALGCFARLDEFLRKDERNYTRFCSSPFSDRNSEQIDRETVLPEKTLAVSGDTVDSFVSIERGSFGWDKKAVLHNVSLHVRRGQHVVITGPVGCGKSLLLQAILGEVEPIAGSVFVRGTVGYCSQVPWLENITARGNVFRSGPSNASWEERVIDACSLRDVLDSQALDATIGSGGALLSGGERQRLALARAIALRPSLLVLDDVFSGMDRTTKTHITDKLFGRDGILRSLGTTVVQTTHDLYVARAADNGYIIDDSGHLEACRYPIDDPAQHDSLASVPAETIQVDDVAGQPKSTAQKGTVDATNVTDGQVYQAYFHSIGRLNMVVFWLGAIAFVFCLKFPDVWARWWADTGTTSSSKSNGYWLGIYALLNVLPLITVAFWVGHVMLKVIPTSGTGLHEKLLRAVLDATFPFISRVDSGSLINRFNQDLMFVDSRLPLELINTTSALLTCIAQAVLIAVAAVYVLAVLPVLCAVLFLIQHFYLRTSKQLRQLDLQSKAGVQTKLSESYEGLVTIRAHGWQNIMRREFQESLSRSQEPFYLLYMVQTWLKLVLNLVVTGLSVTVFGVAVGLRHSSLTTAGGVGVAILNIATLGETMTDFISSWTSLETSLGAIARIQAFEKDTPTEETVQSTVEIQQNWPNAGHVRLDGVYASYQPEAEEPVWRLSNVSLEIRPGEKVAVCGRTGCGKSTLLLAVLALVETRKGTISIDKIDISCVPRSLLRSRLHVVAQDTFIPDETVREALALDKDLPDEAIIEALRECGIFDIITSSGGLSANLADINLSAGEAQLLPLARTMLQASSKKGGIVLLDEAMSSIDMATEERIMGLMKTRFHDKTVISILHRLETALLYDRVVVLEGGRVAHFGTPDEVVRDSALFAPLRK